MMLNHIDEMRLFMEVSDHKKKLLQEAYTPEEVVLVEEVDHKAMLLEELQFLMSKMKGYSESTGSQDYAMGVEVGLNMAAEMIENLISKINEEEE